MELKQGASRFRRKVHLFYLNQNLTAFVGFPESAIRTFTNAFLARKPDQIVAQVIKRALLIPHELGHLFMTPF